MSIQKLEGPYPKIDRCPKTPGWFQFQPQLCHEVGLSSWRLLDLCWPKQRGSMHMVQLVQVLSLPAISFVTLIYLLPILFSHDFWLYVAWYVFVYTVVQIWCFCLFWLRVSGSFTLLHFTYSHFGHLRSNSLLRFIYYHLFFLSCQWYIYCTFTRWFKTY